MTTQIQQTKNLAVFSEPMHITDDSHCCLKVNSVIAKEGVYDFPAGQNGENLRCLWSKRELLDATRTARAAKLCILDHPPNRIVTAQDEIYGIVEKPFFDRDKIRAILNFDKTRCPPDFLEDIRKAEAKQGPPKDVSIGFYYDADETPGVWNGQAYDLIMRNIVIDHVAAGVWKGRCSFPDCGIGVARADFKSFQESRVKRIGGKQTEMSTKKVDEAELDEHGCKPDETWDGTKCVAKPPEEKPKEESASEGESPTATDAPAPPEDNKAEVDEHGCYISSETWSQELERCVPNTDDAPDIPLGETTPQAASLIDRSNRLLEMKRQRDIERVKAERRHPA
jgi:hypothetical protein